MKVEKNPLYIGAKVVIGDYVFVVIKVTNKGNLMLRPIRKLPPPEQEVTVVANS